MRYGSATLADVCTFTDIFIWNQNSLTLLWYNSSKGYLFFYSKCIWRSYFTHSHSMWLLVYKLCFSAFLTWIMCLPRSHDCAHWYLDKHWGELSCWDTDCWVWLRLLEFVKMEAHPNADNNWWEASHVNGGRGSNPGDLIAQVRRKENENYKVKTITHGMIHLTWKRDSVASLIDNVSQGNVGRQCAPCLSPVKCCQRCLSPPWSHISIPSASLPASLALCLSLFVLSSKGPLSWRSGRPTAAS